MKNCLSSLLQLALVAFVTLGAIQAHANNLEEGLVLTKTGTLKVLESKGFSLPALLTQNPAQEILSNKDLAELAVFKPVLANLKAELASIPADGRPFDFRYLKNPNARFILVGIINRADRGYHTGNRCGEIRFVYRLAYNVTDHGASVFSRLPMTINLVFRAGTSGDDTNCAAVASAWLRTSLDAKSDEWLTSGPLSPTLFSHANLHALELNLQTDRSGAGAFGNFGGKATYLLKVYDWVNGALQEAYLENQINRDALLKDAKLLKELKAWIFDPANAKAIDDGTFVLPKKFLAKRALSIAPGGMARSANRMYYGIISSEEVKPTAFASMEQIQSATAFMRRLNDSTCTGCHQSRAIGGFHFTGIDPFGKYPGNSVYLPGSAHFTGDLPRRRLIVESIATRASVVDFSRGFSLRPQEHRSKQLVSTGLLDGWSAPCTTTDDPSFASWTCGKGLVCKQLLESSDKVGIGTCVSETQKVGDPCEFGKTTTKSFGVDVFKRTNEREVSVPNAMCSPQSQDPGTKTGGFLNGNIRKKSCEDGPGEPGLPPEANCGPLPASRPGFNACVGKKNFDVCLREFSTGVGLRGCDQLNPCRDDYICAESFRPDRGVCVPPYFLFQFRVDGHPKGDL